MPNKPSKKPVADMESVAQFFCEKSGWTLTAFRLQKMMYFAQMHYMGDRRRRLFDGAFEARKHGPALRELYGVVRDFGDTPIAKGTFANAKPIKKDHDAYYILLALHDSLRPVTLHQICETTRRDTSAWVKHYSWQQVNTLADEDVMKEYDAAKARAFPNGT